MTNDVALPGCRLEPLGSYLKAIGLHRLVAEQRDPTAAGQWQAGSYVLRSGMNDEGLLDFLVSDYRPTPLVAPWNGRGGFRRDAGRESEKVVQEIEATTDERLAPYRQAIASARQLFDAADWAEQDKASQVLRCRAVMPDEVVAWLDAAVVLTSEGAVYPPILGTGGNLGSMDLSNNFMQRMMQVLALRKGRRSPSVEDSREWARAALFDVGAPALMDAAIGQFDPGGAGGVNAAPVGQAESVVNPWDFILLLEGSLLFASAAARRLGSDQRGRAAMPFTVDSSAVGYASGTEAESSKGEIWTPVWERLVTLPELAYLLGEGRAAWRGRQVRTGLDMVKAVSSLGVDRGLHRFVRHAFVERLGQSTIAVGVGQVRVSNRLGVNVLADLDAWAGRLRGESRRQGTPGAVMAAAHRVEAAEYALAHTGGSGRLQAVLTAVADAEMTVGRSKAFRGSSGLTPVPWIEAERWLPLLDDGSPELRLAACLALARDRDGSGLRSMLHPIRLEGRRNRPVWSNVPPRVPGLGRRSLVDVLASCLVWRVRSIGAAEREEDGSVGVRPAFPYGPTPQLGDVAALAAGAVDVARLDALLRGLLLLGPPAQAQSHRWRDAHHLEFVTPPAWQFLAPFFARVPLIAGGVTVELRAQAEWAPLLVASRTAEVLGQALMRYRMARMQPVLSSVALVAVAAPPGTRLAAALLCRPGRRAAQDALQRSIDPDQGEAA